MRRTGIIADINGAGGRRRPVLRLSLTMALILTFALCGCGIFDMKIPEPPLDSGEIDDPLNMADIIRGVFPEIQPGIDYGSYFTDNAEFHCYQLYSIHGKEVIRMLDALRSGSPRTLRVEWLVNRAGGSWREGSVHYLNGVPYNIHQNGVLTYKGAADFRISISGDGYRISYWKDTPDGAPFFEP
ncbi:MAG: hypothetical protein FWB85_01440 [Chitinispirillia bacterium]|nr:hypothetical protein [Chitinispirillia bacterium]MCL2241347.1 hypothetical protein [Chitinispirillia bacterium]